MLLNKLSTKKREEASISSKENRHYGRQKGDRMKEFITRFYGKENIEQADGESMTPCQHEGALLS